MERIVWALIILASSGPAWAWNDATHKKQVPQAIVDERGNWASGLDWLGRPEFQGLKPNLFSEVVPKLFPEAELCS